MCGADVVAKCLAECVHLMLNMKSKIKPYSHKSILHKIYLLGFYSMSALTKSDAKEHETNMCR